jgi:predicted Zn-dependent protease
VLDEMTDSAATDIARAEKLVGQALAASPHSALVRRAKGFVLRAQGRPEEAIPEFEAVIARAIVTGFPQFVLSAGVNSTQGRSKR